MADNKSRGLSIELDVDVSNAIKGLKAVQREAKEATKALRDLESAYFGEWFTHDDKSCQALREYEESPLKKTASLMMEIAKKHKTTVGKMKNHWKCIENSK